MKRLLMLDIRISRKARHSFAHNLPIARSRQHAADIAEAGVFPTISLVAQRRAHKPKKGSHAFQAFARLMDGNAVILTFSEFSTGAANLAYGETPETCRGAFFRPEAKCHFCSKSTFAKL
ncbi:protein of unknown function [Candidatus Filomicrobium marinum]|uniref:Uncharacterized protein n=1 Tax=Candidatus Filomicrobium marinum TaxID=1608628 RepID=A0A0D6JGU1_9HYPH|nr:protein of unknown function [Candidatus Filomicrobium marinum]CPR19748.1 protein of unknown function [Candidatus Filomicrobium marinum]